MLTGALGPGATQAGDRCGERYTCDVDRFLKTLDLSLSTRHVRLLTSPFLCCRSLFTAISFFIRGMCSCVCFFIRGMCSYVCF